MTKALLIRAILGFVAAVIAVLTFHQGMVLLLRETSLLGIPATAKVWNLAVNPNGVPAIVNLCFWGGLYGAVFGALSPRFAWPLWFCGLLTGFIAALVGMFIVPAIKGLPVGGGWALMNWARSFTINGSFGLGLGLIYPLIARPRD
jgi:tetrahydromethanopterin S-methyltransferase subunit C